MSKGTEIIVSSNPKGVFLEGIIDDASYPGTVMEVTPAATFVSGRPHWRHYQPSADGDPRLQAVLLPDYLQGVIGIKAGATPPGLNTAYTIGQRCFLYVPLPGEEMNLIFAGAAGTGSANAVTIGERLIVQHTSGKLLIESTSSIVAPWMSMEHLDGTADVDFYIWVMRQ